MTQALAVDADLVQQVVDEFKASANLERIAWKLKIPEAQVREILARPGVGEGAVREKAREYGAELVGTVLDRLLTIVKHGEPQHMIAAARLMMQIVEKIGEPPKEEREEKSITLSQAITLLDDHAD